MAMELSMRSLLPSRMKNFFQKYPERYAAESRLLKLMCTNIFARDPCTSFLAPQLSDINCWSID